MNVNNKSAIKCEYDPRCPKITGKNQITEWFLHLAEATVVIAMFTWPQNKQYTK